MTRKLILFVALVALFIIWGCGEKAVESETDTSDSSGDSDSDHTNDSDSDSPDTSDTGDTSDGSDDSESDNIVDGPSNFGCEEPIEGGGTRSGYHTFFLDICGDSYNVQTNPWGGATQTITAGGENVFVVDSLEPPDYSFSEVVSYPSVYKGKNQGGDGTTNSGMPIQVSDIQSVETGFSHNGAEMYFYGNATYDVYFTNSSTYNSGQPDRYLMVWLYTLQLNPITDQGYSCGGEDPKYTSACSGAGSLEIGGVEFYRFVGTNGSRPVISYLPVDYLPTFEFDLNEFIQDAVAQEFLTDDMYLQSIQAGFELIRDADGATAYGFYADVQ
ncbi:MAG: hypothetical protein JXX29_18860 [Deltaproteobacteria bacterium]|nr:hypothetical protein [Deltaproteobacteria bacterium]MBN2673747.1 hypothetical protein [Deltaproteobacteria bacterium]